MASGQRLLHQDINHIAVFGVQGNQAAMLLEGLHGAKDGAVVHHQAAAVGHVHLDAGHTLVDKPGHLLQTCFVHLNRNEVKGVIDACTPLGLALPGIVDMLEQITLALLGKVDQGCGPPYGRSTAPGYKIIAGSCAPSEILQMRMWINTTRNHHSASGIDDFRLVIRDVTGNLGNDAIDNEHIGLIVIHRSNNVSIFHQRAHARPSPGNAAVTPRSPLRILA
jgi:hypothetical protein